jgi:hypothetical protein
MLYGQAPDATRLLEVVTANAEAFRQNARNLLSAETLVQRCYRIPEHARISIGKAADTLYAQLVLHEVQSEYRIGTIPTDRSGNLFEVRSVMTKDGATIRTPAAADEAMQMDISAGEARIQKKAMAVFTDLGLLDVATNYGLMLLLFTPSGIKDLELNPVGARYFGAEDAYVFRWRQTKGGVLELRNHNPIRRPMEGELWVRTDGMPLRITSRMEYDEPKHRIREDATLEFVWSSAGCAMPLLAVHRHYVDGRFLTENFYTYEPFRRFGVDTQIRYSDTPKK